MIRYAFAIASFAIAATLAAAAPPAAGYTANVPVGNATRIDWTFAVTNQSLAQPPADLLGKGYDSTAQSYELYLPVRKDPKAPIPAIVFISAGNDAAGWKAFEPVCTKQGIAFIGIRGAGNNVPPPKRVRIVLDCLDDVRRQVPLDPDRTYISGFSGGGRIAVGIAVALPEYFGGIIPIGAGGDLRSEPWLRHRAADRLSAALLTGDSDFNRGEVERWTGPYWTALGIRSKVWVQPKTGHAMASSTTLAVAVAWLEEGKAQRAKLATAYPASRAKPDSALTREDDAKALFAEGQKKLAAKGSLYRGLMLVKGAADRWPDTATGKAARKLLEESEAKKDRPWEDDDIAEQRTQLIAEARSLGDYALNGIPAGSTYEKSRPDMARKVIEIWSALIADAPDSEVSKEGRKKVEELKAIAGKDK